MTVKVRTMNANEARKRSAQLRAQERLATERRTEKRQKDMEVLSRESGRQSADQVETLIQDILRQISRSAQQRVRVATLRIEPHRRRFTFSGWDYYPCLSPEIQQVCEYFRDLGYRIEVTRNWFQKNDIRNVYICW